MCDNAPLFITPHAMRISNDVVPKNKYKHLSSEQRTQIKTLKDHWKSQAYIADYIWCTQPTVSRELSRNVSEDRRGKGVYKASKAQWLYKDRRVKANLHHNFYMKHRLLPWLLEKLLKQWHSPDVIANRILQEETTYILSTTTIYNYIRYKQPLFRRYLEFKFGYRKHQWQVKVPKICPDLPRIHERPEDINNRIWDWDREVDSVVSVWHLWWATTLTNRKHRFLLFKRASRLTWEQTLYNIVWMLEWHKVNSITSDNGSEFCYLDVIAIRLMILCYLCHPYCSREKWSNEKNNREIRRYIPKGSNFEDYTDEQLQEIQDKINRKPRKILGYKSAYESYYWTQLKYLN